MPTQAAELFGIEPKHTHFAQIHTHEHYHVVHYCFDGLNCEEHRIYSHEHTHAYPELTHSHALGSEDDERRHERGARVHDHVAPTLHGDMRPRWCEMLHLFAVAVSPLAVLLSGKRLQAALNLVVGPLALGAASVGHWLLFVLPTVHAVFRVQRDYSDRYLGG